LETYGKTKPDSTKAEMYYATQNKHKKLKPGLVTSYNVAWKRRGPIVVSALHKFVNYLLTYFDTYPLTYGPSTHMGHAFQQHNCLIPPGGVKGSSKYTLDPVLQQARSFVDKNLPGFAVIRCHYRDVGMWQQQRL